MHDGIELVGKFDCVSYLQVSSMHNWIGPDLSFRTTHLGFCEQSKSQLRKSSSCELDACDTRSKHR